MDTPSLFPQSALPPSSSPRGDAAYTAEIQPAAASSGDATSATLPAPEVFAPGTPEAGQAFEWFAPYAAIAAMLGFSAFGVAIGSYLATTSTAAATHTTTTTSATSSGTSSSSSSGGYFSQSSGGSSFNGSSSSSSSTPVTSTGVS